MSHTGLNQFLNGKEITMAFLTTGRQTILGVVLVVVGAIFFVRHFSNVTFGEVWHFLWPLILVAVGVIFLGTLRRK